ncbi:putative bifunctional diguanylate cyclase/phosphodiesterase, partial [Actinoplanes philippinensis]|uniref:putative bifunctional diguanylate cyclase/phosphodiesterase n=1 Tax=Actinoplanes philippinensis TaxID=35752 RepID=UPI0033FBAB4C
MNASATIGRGRPRTRWGRLLARRATARSAVAGTAVGIVTLAVSAVLAANGTAEATREVRRAQEIIQVLDDIAVRVNTQDAALREYLAAGGTEDRTEQLAATLDSARDGLDWLQAHDAVDRLELDTIRGAYADYSQIVVEIMTQTEKGAKVQGYAEPAALAFAPLRDQVLTNVRSNQEALAGYLAAVDRQAAVLRRVAEVTGLIVSVLFAVCALVLVGYQRRAERQVARRLHEATHDSLTGLGNRAMLHDELEAAVRHGEETTEPFSLLLLDLDRFKEVNDTLGHHAGDELLVEVARRLDQGCRAGDVVVRLGGDEFALILPTTPEQPEAVEAGHRILAALRKPIQLSGLTVDIDASIGVAVYPTDGANAAELLQHADVAMYAAKRRHGGVTGYDASLDEGDAGRLTLQSELRQGIERGELVVFYQPKVDVATRMPCGAEALVRWQHPTRGLLAPDTFIPLAEETGLIDLITAEVLDQALAQIAHWTRLDHGLPVSVNVPARSLSDDTFPATVAAALERHRVRPELLTLEITESAVIADMMRAGEVLVVLALPDPHVGAVADHVGLTVRA